MSLKEIKLFDMNGRPMGSAMFYNHDGSWDGVHELAINDIEEIVDLARPKDEEGNTWDFDLELP